MKDIINIFDSETRAMAFVQMELSKMLEAKKTFTKNELKLKEILKHRLNVMMDACAAMQEVVGRLLEIGEFEMLHIIDPEEFLRNDDDTSASSV